MRYIQMVQKTVMFSFISLIALLAILFLCPASNAAAAELAATTATATSPAVIVRQFREAATKLKSASYVEYRSDYADKFVASRHKKALEAYKPILDKISLVTRKKYTMDTSVGGYRETESHVMFVKPFLMQVKMVKNDYIPDFLQGATAIYRPDINPGEASLKEPFLGLVFRKSVNVDSAVTMVINWTFDMLELDCMQANGGKMTSAGIEQVGGRDAYRVDFDINNNTVPWNMDCSAEKYGIPAETYGQMNLELGMMNKRLKEYKGKKAVLSLWFDPENHLTIRKEVRFGDIVAIKSRKENIVLNKVKKKKMFKVRKP